MAAVSVALRIGEAERHFDGKPRILPRAISAAQAAHLLVAHLLQRLAGEQAARTTRAVENDVRVAIGHRLLDAQLQKAARHLFGAGENALIGFLLFPDVDDGRAPSLQLFRELPGSHLDDLRASDFEQLVLGLCLCHHGAPVMLCVEQGF